MYPHIPQCVFTDMITGLRIPCLSNPDGFSKRDCKFLRRGECFEPRPTTWDDLGDWEPSSKICAAATQLKPSEVAWQSFVLGAAIDGVPSSRLRCLVIHCILNENTEDVIFETSRTSSSTFEKANDHKSEMRYRLVNRMVHLGRKDRIPGLEWGLARTLLIILSGPRPRTRAASEPPCSPERTSKRRILSQGSY